MEEKDVYKELSSIRELMERSSKFISLSGLSGILAGIYALAGAGLAYMLIQNSSPETIGLYGKPVIFWQWLLIAKVVLILSAVTAYWLSVRKAKSRQENVWNPVSRRLLAASGIPFFTGALFVGIMLLKGEYTTVASACLIFYGLALVAGSQFTFTEVKWLGIGEILLGLLALILPGHGLLLWAIGFGLLHILYGSIMHFKYER
jgi:hypothetical protein